MWRVGHHASLPRAFSQETSNIARESIPCLVACGEVILQPNLSISIPSIWHVPISMECRPRRYALALAFSRGFPIVSSGSQIVFQCARSVTAIPHVIPDRRLASSSQFYLMTASLNSVFANVSFLLRGQGHSSTSFPVVDSNVPWSPGSNHASRPITL
jgi:hypothetical protein